MRATPRILVRSLIALAVTAAVVVAYAATASGQTVSSGDPATTVAPGAAAGSSGIAGSGAASSGSIVVPYPGCCNAVPGVSASGQSTVPGRSPAARDRAITQAVADATEQAQAAATAAGISLGAIEDLQVSASPNVYPLAYGAGGTEPSTAVVTTYASVTITWAIA